MPYAPVIPVNGYNVLCEVRQEAHHVSPWNSIFDVVKTEKFRIEVTAEQTKYRSCQKVASIQRHLLF